MCLFGVDRKGEGQASACPPSTSSGQADEQSLLRQCYEGQASRPSRSFVSDTHQIRIPCHQSITEGSAKRMDKHMKVR